MSLNVWFCHFTNQTFLQLQANAYGIWDKIRQEKKTKNKEWFYSRNFFISPYFRKQLVVWLEAINDTHNLYLCVIACDPQNMLV